MNFESTQPAYAGAPPMQKAHGGNPTNPFEMPSSPPPPPPPNDARAEDPTSPAGPGDRAMASPPTSPPPAASTNPFDSLDLGNLYAGNNATSPTSVTASGGFPQVRQQQNQTQQQAPAGLQVPAMQQQQPQQQQMAQPSSTTTNPFESSFGAPPPAQQPPRQQQPRQQQPQEQPPQPPAQHQQQALVPQGAETNLDYANYSLGTQYQQNTNQPDPYGAPPLPPVPPPPVPPTEHAPPAPPSAQQSFDTYNAPSLHHGHPICDSNSWGATPQTSDLSSSGQQQQQQAANVDPFGGAFDSAPRPAPVQEHAPAPVRPPAQQQPQPPQAQAQPQAANNNAGDDDFWASMGFGAPAAPAAPIPAAVNNEAGAPAAEPKAQAAPKAPLTFDSNGLPAGGETYHCRVHTSTLGVLFFKAKDLKETLYQKASAEAVDALGIRPAVGHVFVSSAAEASGIGLGHIVLSVNGENCTSPDHATHLIKTMPRPLNLQVYAPPRAHVPVYTNEGNHMVKYDTVETGAPQSKLEWKVKYVVVGGVIARPLQMNMYRTKAEYDTAVRETQSGQPSVSVKVKQFDLSNAKLLYNSEGQPREVSYRETWRYLCVVPQEGCPIKIAASSVERLKPVHEGIKRAILASKALSRAAEAEEEEYMKAGRVDPSSYKYNLNKRDITNPPQYRSTGGGASGGGGGEYDQFGGTDYYGNAHGNGGGGNSDGYYGSSGYQQGGGGYANAAPNHQPPPQQPTGSTNFGNQPNWAQY